MKQNIYDDKKFFVDYLNYRRSSKSLNSALEQPYLHSLLPDLKGKRILDLGSGMGFFCQYALERGAEYVLGVDISSQMCSFAATLLQDLPKVRIVNSAIEDFYWDGDSFDLIVSSLALHYIESLSDIIKRTSK